MSSESSTTLNNESSDESFSREQYVAEYNEIKAEIDRLQRQQEYQRFSDEQDGTRIADKYTPKIESLQTDLNQLESLAFPEGINQFHYEAVKQSLEERFTEPKLPDGVTMEDSVGGLFMAYKAEVEQLHKKIAAGKDFLHDKDTFAQWYSEIDQQQQSLQKMKEVYTAEVQSFRGDTDSLEISETTPQPEADGPAGESEIPAPAPAESLDKSESKIEEIEKLRTDYQSAKAHYTHNMRLLLEAGDGRRLFEKKVTSGRSPDIDKIKKWVDASATEFHRLREAVQEGADEEWSSILMQDDKSIKKLETRTFKYTSPEILHVQDKIERYRQEIEQLHKSLSQEQKNTADKLREKLTQAKKDPSPEETSSIDPTENPAENDPASSNAAEPEIIFSSVRGKKNSNAPDRGGGGGDGPLVLENPIFLDEDNLDTDNRHQPDLASAKSPDDPVVLKEPPVDVAQKQEVMDSLKEATFRIEKLKNIRKALDSAKKTSTEENKNQEQTNNTIQEIDEKIDDLKQYREAVLQQAENNGIDTEEIEQEVRLDKQTIITDTVIEQLRQTHALGEAGYDKEYRTWLAAKQNGVPITESNSWSANIFGVKGYDVYSEVKKLAEEGRGVSAGELVAVLKENDEVIRKKAIKKLGLKDKPETWQFIESLAELCTIPQLRITKDTTSVEEVLQRGFALATIEK